MGVRLTHFRMGGIFISHTHSDYALADALRDLVKTLLGQTVPVHYSTEKEEGGGISFGADWFRWITDKVETADVAFIVVTPSSIQKPWVIWEAGAVSGAAFASKKPPKRDPKEGQKEEEEDPRVIPLIYGVSTSDLPDFFARFQTVDATAKANIEKLTYSVNERFGDRTGAGWKRYYDARDAAIGTYLGSVEKILKDLPLLVTEASIQEWLERLNDLERGGRFSEAAVLESWMTVAFGREDEATPRPLDVRIHRRLGELYAKAGDIDRAVKQFELALRLVPRDIFILRRLGKAYLDQKNLEEADKILARIFKLDKTAFEKNVENAALKARACRAKNDFAGARDVLKPAFDFNSNSYYLGDLLGQTYITLGDTAAAKETYTRVRRILRELGETNVWTRATGLTASIVLGDDAGLEHEIEELRDLEPTREELRSVERGVADLMKALGREDNVSRRLRDMEPEQNAGK